VLKNLLATYVAKFRWLATHHTYDQPRAEAAERDKFRQLGFDLDQAFRSVDELLAGLGKPSFTSQQGMASMHWVLFACVAQRFEVRRILEIGTYDGETTLLLSRLFPDAKLTTVELPDNDPIFGQTYGREDPAKRKAFLERQARNTAGPSIEPVKVNSFFLPALGLDPFDLIWADGSHLYPEVAWDVCNCYQLCRPGGVLMVDDVMMHPRAVQMGYGGPAPYEVLEYLGRRVEDPIIYFMKRYSPEWSADPRLRSHVAMLLKGQP